MTPDWDTIHFFWKYCGQLLAVIVCGLALWQGGRAEKIGGAMTALSWYLSGVFANSGGRGPADIIVIIDIVTMLAFGGLALWSRRPWAFAFTACMINVVITHYVARSFNLGIFSYVTATGFWGGYGILACLGAGVFDSWRKRRRARQALTLGLT